MGTGRSTRLPVRRSHLAFSLGLFAVLLALFYGSPVRTSFDSRWAVHTAMSFARGHWGDLSEYMPILEKEALHAIEYYRDGPHTSFPIGVSVLAVPAVAIVSLIDPSFNEALRHALPVELEGLLAAICGALAGVGFFWIIAARFNDQPLALLSTAMFCLCTSMWSTATRALWQHGPLVLVWLVVMALLREARSRPRAIQYLGLPLAMAFIIRPMSAVGILVLSVYVFVLYRRWFLRYILWALPLALPWLAINLSIYGFLFPPYYLRTAGFSRPVFGEALLGNLVSPGRGLFVYSPVLLFALPGFVISLREREERGQHLAFGIIVVLHWLAVSLLAPTWWAGHSYGPRLMTDVLPFLVYFLVFALRARWRGALPRAAVWGGLSLLAGVSLLMHAHGALDEAPYRWNVEPANVDTHPARVWSWDDPQFARGLSRSPARPLLKLTGGKAPSDVKVPGSRIAIRFQGRHFDRSVLGSGWSRAEGWGIWSDGPEARLVLGDPSRVGSGDLLFIVNATGFVTPKHPRQVIDVEVNGAPIGLWTFEVGEGYVERRARIPSSLAAGQTLAITFRIRSPASPAALGMANDDRRLGIGLTGVRVVSVDDVDDNSP